MGPFPAVRQHAVLALVVALATGLSLTIAPRPAQSARLTIAVGGRVNVPELQRLLGSGPVAAAAIRDLRLEGTTPEALLRRLRVRALPAALDVRFADRSQAQAQRVVQDIGLVFSQLVHERFGGEAVASISDPARPAGAVERPWARNLLLATLAGLVLSALATAVPGLGASRPARAGVRRPGWGTMSASAPTSHRKD